MIDGDTGPILVQSIMFKFEFESMKSKLFTLFSTQEFLRNVDLMCYPIQITKS